MDEEIESEEAQEHQGYASLAKEGPWSHGGC